MFRTFVLGTAASAALAMPGAAAAQTTVDLWHIFSLETDMIHGAVAAWNESNPDVRIESRVVPLAQLNTEMTKAFATGSVPDLVTVGNESMASFASQGALTDITDLVEGSQSLHFDDYYDGPRASATWDGRVYGVPRAVNTIALYMNREMMAANGLDPDSPPATWAELQRAAATLTDPDAGVYGIAFSAIQSEEGTFQWLPWLQQAGGSVADLDSPEAAAALQVWADLVADGHASQDVLTMRQYEATNTFIAGNTAMVISGPWELPRVSEEARFDWQVGLLPVKDDVGIQASALGGFVFAIPAGSDNVEEAFAVIEYMQSDEVLQNAWDIGRLPPRPSVVIEDPAYAQAYDAFQEQMQFARVRGPHPQWPEISRHIQTAIQEAVAGQSTPEEALAKAAEQVDPMLEEIPLPEGSVQ